MGLEEFEYRPDGGRRLVRVQPALLEQLFDCTRGLAPVNSNGECSLTASILWVALIKRLQSLALLQKGPKTHDTGRGTG
jgi:hypothetical protein